MTHVSLSNECDESHICESTTVDRSHDEIFKRWLKEVMSKIIKNLGPNVEEAQYELSESAKYYMSSQYYVNVRFKNRMTGQNEELSMILKKPLSLENLRNLICSDIQFSNEIVFYSMYAQSDENFPRSLYLAERPPVDSVIALEDLRKKGYYPCSYKYNVPLEYTLVVMREMGRFHGKGYVMKDRQREKFLDIVARLKEPRFNEEQRSKGSPFFNFVSTRAVEYLRSRGHSGVFYDKVEAVLSNAFEEMMKMSEPLEPLATFCHGDFTVSNILFKTEDDGQHRAMIIDFAMAKYSTPGIDLSTYLCLCCSNEIRREKFSEIFGAYHDALMEYLLKAGVRNIERYSYNALLDNFRRTCLYGFVIASFFLVILMGCLNEDIETVGFLDIRERAVRNKEAGGDEFSRILADMLLHLKELGCLKHVS